jgi:hypothetical protein
MIKKLVLTSSLAVLALGASLAWGAGATPLHENASGLFLEDFSETSAVFALDGTVNGTPVAGSLSGQITANLSKATPNSACYKGRVPFTGTVTLTDSGTGDQLVKKETGTICASPTSQTVSFTGTYSIAGGASTGVFSGAHGSGNVNYTLTADSGGGHGTFRSVETGVVVLRSTGVRQPR